MIGGRNPLKRNIKKEGAEPFQRKMTPEVIAKAKKLFDEGIYSCKDVADNIDVSIRTLRNYLPNECWQATQRDLERQQKRRA